MNLSTSESDTNTGIHHEIDLFDKLESIENEESTDREDDLDLSVSSKATKAESDLCEIDTPKAKKRRKQSNPVRYGQSIRPFDDIEDTLQAEKLGENDEEDDHEEGEIRVKTFDEDEDNVEEGEKDEETGEHDEGDNNDGNDDNDDDDDVDDDDDDVDDNDVRLVERKRKRISSDETAIDYSSLQSKYHCFCSHCGCPFVSEGQLKRHIEEEHVQKIIEQQLLHHQSLLNAKHSPSSNGLSVIKSLNENAISSIDKLNNRLSRSDSGKNSDSEQSSRANSPLNSSPTPRRKSFELNLPQPDSDQPPTAKDFASLLSFHLPKVPVPPLLPLASSSGQQGVTGSGTGSSGSSGTGQEKQTASMQLAMFPNHIAPFLYPVLLHTGSGVINSQSSGMSGGAMTHNEQVNTSGSNSAVKIFNPEAYCELCNKELCNKYFLKTHKANKHRIFSMESGGVVPLSNSPSAAAAAAFFPSNMSPAATGNSSSTAATAALQMQHLLQHVNVSSSSEAATQAAALALAASRSSAVTNMESYCDICQKHFCNKYFLRKHRQKIHGIYDSSLSQSSAPTQSSKPGSLPNEEPIHHSSSVSLASSADSDRLSPKLPTSPINAVATSSSGGAVPLNITRTSVTPEKMSSIVTSSAPEASTTASSSPLNFSTDFTCDICKLEFSNSALLQAHRTTAHGLLFSGNHSNLQSVAAELQADAIAGMIGRPINLPASFGDLSNIIFTPDRLREIGVINADAFCEICCKEFCNKYFLRTHKLNKHGISIDNASSDGSVTSGHHPSRLDKGVRDENEPSSPKSFTQDDSNLEAGQRDSLLLNPDFQLINSSKEFFCDICNRNFGSNYFLTMHKFYCHEVPYARDTDSPVKSQTSNDETTLKEEEQTVDLEPQSAAKAKSYIDLALNSGLTDQQPSDQASQELKNLQIMIKELNTCAFSDKAVCSLCRKEFESKYFLRRHMIKDHSLLSADGSLDSSSLMRSMFESSRIAFPSGSGAYSSYADLEAFSETKSTKLVHLEGTTATTPSTCKSQDEQGSSESKSSNKLPNPVPISSPGKLNLPTSSANTSAAVNSFESKPRVLTGRNYCNICNKELCNKYFMKTHMLKMHGINIDEHPAEAAVTSIIGGVTCDICQKELCSKYFLKVHKQNTHGIAEEPPQTKDSRSDNVDKESSLSQAQGIDPNDINNRYFSHYTEVCPLCERRFKSIKWLKTHMTNDHSDILPGRQSELTSPNPSELARICLICGHFFQDRTSLQLHFVKDHKANSDELGISSTGTTNSSGMLKNKPISFASNITGSPSQAAAAGSPHGSLSQTTGATRGDNSPEITPAQSPLDGQSQAHVTASRLNGSVSPNNGSSEMNTNVTTSLTTQLTSILSSNSSLNSCAMPSLTTSSADAIMSSADPEVDLKAKSCNDLNINKSLPANLNQSLTATKRSLDRTFINYCSYCNYSTRWVSNLYAHEKRHREINFEGDKKFNCRICHRAYRYNHSLQRHLQNHRSAGLGGLREALGSSSNHQRTRSLILPYSTPSGHLKDQPHTRLDSSNFEIKPAKVKRYRCSKCNRKFKTRDQCLSHIYQLHAECRKGTSSGSGIKNTNTNRSLFRCSNCGFSTRNPSLLKIHIIKKHSKASFESAESADYHIPLNLRKTSLLSSSAREEALSLVVNERSKLDSETDSSPHRCSPHHNRSLQSISSTSSSLPMAYAMPQSSPNHGSFIMQPFLITQPDTDRSLRNENFVPSLVYLPVSQKVLQPVTVAFQLTPA